MKKTKQGCCCWVVINESLLLDCLLSPLLCHHVHYLLVVESQCLFPFVIFPFQPWVGSEGQNTEHTITFSMWQKLWRQFLVMGKAHQCISLSSINNASLRTLQHLLGNKAFASLLLYVRSTSSHHLCDMDHLTFLPKRIITIWSMAMILPLSHMISGISGSERSIFFILCDEEIKNNHLNG